MATRPWRGPVFTIWSRRWRRGNQWLTMPWSFNKKQHLSSSPDIASKVVAGVSLPVPLARAYDMSTKNIHAVLSKDLNLSKKSARWVPKLNDEWRMLNDDMKKEQERASEGFFLAMVRHHPMSMLDNIVIMYESAMSFHTPSSRANSGLKKGSLLAYQGRSPRHEEMQMVLRASFTQTTLSRGEWSMPITSLRPSLESWEFSNRRGRRWWPSLGWCSRAHSPCSNLQDGSQAVQDHHAPGDPEEGVEEGCENPLDGELCHGLPAVVRVLREVQEDRRQLNWEEK